MHRITISLATLTLLGTLSAVGCDSGSRHGDAKYEGTSQNNSSTTTDSGSSAYGTGGPGVGGLPGVPGTTGPGTSNGNVSITAISPATGLPGGGTLVTLNGTGFLQGAQVFFGTSPSPDVKVEGPDKLTALTPPGTGLVDVDVVNTNNTFAKLNNAFTYDPNASNPNNQIYARVADYGEPTAEDQELLELINEARRNPTAAGPALGLDLSSYVAKPPLSHNRVLGELSHAHSKNMAAKADFGHVVDNVGPNGRILASTYDLNQEYGTDPLKNFTESIIAGSPTSTPRVATPQDVFANWMIDQGQNPPKHRNAILGVGNLLGKSRESGMGFETGLTSTIPASTWVTNEYARTKLDKPFVLGAVYNDGNASQTYQAGEGQPNVPVSLTHDASGFQVTTNSKQAGGYAFEVLIPGQYTLDINGQKQALTVDATNQKVDAVNGTIVVP